MKFKFITDRDDISDLPSVLRKEINQRGLFTAKNSNNVSFCGMMINNDTVYMFIPRSSDYSKINKMEFACILMSMLERYATQNKSHITSDDEENIEVGLCYLNLAKELLSDYRTYGLYKKVSKKELINSGKINWKRTFQKELPIFIHSNSPFYLEYYGYKFTSFHTHEISKIHAEIVHKLDYNLSWWLNRKVGLLIAPDLAKFEKSTLTIEEKIYILNKELNQAYSDREIKLLKNLITFLSQEPGTASTILVLGIKKFEQLWENMLRVVLRGTNKANDNRLPIPVYKHTTNPLSDLKRPGMKLDIFIKDDKLLTGAVIDAKYYDAKDNNSESLPALGDILKQICYLNAVQLVHRNLIKINNIFIFPGTHNTFSHIEFNHKQIEQSEILKVFPQIYCVYLNPVDVIKAYVNNQYLDDLRTSLLSEN